MTSAGSSSAPAAAKASNAAKGFRLRAILGSAKERTAVRNRRMAASSAAELSRPYRPAGRNLVRMRACRRSGGKWAEAAAARPLHAS
eukprot:13495864-Alexandrium_andersonii.AAC.1